MSIDETRFKVLMKNSGKCLKCSEVLVSEHRHDFKWCSCRSLAVDGGKSYIKRSYISSSDYEELSEYRNMTKEELQCEIDQFQSDLGEYYSPYQHDLYHERLMLAKKLMGDWYGL